MSSSPSDSSADAPAGNGATALRFARTAGGYCVRVEGRGTMKESPCVQEFAAECLGRPASADPASAVPASAESPGELVLDLTDCTYLDSTFVGCILGLNRRFGGSGKGAKSAGRARFWVAAPQAKRAALFGAMGVGGLLHFIDAAPAAGAWTTLAPHAIDSADRARHVMECHRQLAAAPGPQQATFAAIAERLGRELGAEDEGA